VYPDCGIDAPAAASNSNREVRRMAVGAERYRFTVDQYHQMAEAGIFHPECRVELIDGEIFEMSPIDPWHSGVVNRLNHRFVTGLGDRAVVHVQNPVGLDARSEPQPDLMLLRPRPDFYGTGHPGPEHAFLLVEVANTSLRHDRGRKLPLYARTGVPEVWIVNRQADAVEIFREPSGRGYRVQDIRRRGQQLAPAAFPDLRLTVDDVLG
jgi:Uma2 family endonuclease